MVWQNLSTRMGTTEEAEVNGFTASHTQFDAAGPTFRLAGADYDNALSEGECLVLHFLHGCSVCVFLTSCPRNRPLRNEFSPAYHAVAQGSADIRPFICSMPVSK